MSRRLPPATIRLRLTATYGGLFIAVGVVLLTITYVLFARQTRAAGPHPPMPRLPGRREWPPMGADETIRDRVRTAVAEQRSDALRELLTQSVLALAIVSVIAVALGWVMAGRVLRPVRDITATARRLSTHNLDERIGMGGPRDEFKELADTFDAMLDRLSAAFEAQRHFVANASHELRTPLTVQRAAVDVALANPSLESFRTMAERVRAATSRHEHLIASLLTLARSERGVERYDAVDLRDAVRDALDAAGPEIEARALRLTSDLGSAPVPGDPVLLGQLAANLIGNAVRHNVAGGWINVRTARTAGSVTLSVANSGPVIPPEQVGRLFEPFRRRGHEGHGLGLSIVAAITTAHGGSQFARARPAGGLDIVITLPAP